LVTKKKILITAGPTWVAIDQVRVISNLATGETGILLADEFRKLGAKVTLLLGAGNYPGTQAGITIKRFKYFSELAWLLNSELKKVKYAAVIHAAAVADYQPRKIINRKISSHLKSWKINLVPTQKLIQGLRAYRPGLFTVGFKFQPNAGKVELIEKGNRLLKKEGLNLVVANSSKNKGYQAYILDGRNQFGPFPKKRKMAFYLARLIAKQL